MAGKDVGSAKYRLETDAAQFQKGLTNAERMADRSAQRIGKRLGGIGTSLGAAGRSLTMGLTLPILGIGAASIKSSYDFDVSMNKVNFLTNVAAGSAAGLETAIMNVSRETATMPTDVAEAFYFVLSSGAKDAAQAQDVLSQSLMAATMGLGSSVDVTRTLLSILNAYELELSNADIIMAQFVETVKAGTAEPDELATSLSRLLPIAKAIGVEFNQLGAGIATITVLTGASGPRAIMALLGSLRSMLRFSKIQRNMLESVNWTMEEFVLMVNKDWGAAMKELTLRFKGNVPLLKKFLGSTEAVNAALALSSESGMDMYNQTLKDMQEGVARWTETQAKFRETREFKLKQNFVDLRIEAIRMGRALQPILDAMIGGLGKAASAARFMVTVFQSMSKPVQIATIVFFGLLAAIGPVLIIAGLLAGAVASLIPVFGMLSLAVIGTIAAFALLAIAIVAAALGAMWVIDNWGLVTKMFSKFFKWLPGAWSNMWRAIIRITVAAVQAILRLVGQMISSIVNALQFWKTSKPPDYRRMLKVQSAKEAGAEVGEAVGEAVHRGYAKFSKDKFADVEKSFAKPLGEIVETAEDTGEEAGEALGEGLAEGAAGGAAAVVETLDDILRNFREQVTTLHDEMGRLAGLETVESVAEDLREAELELERLGLEQAADRAREARQAQIDSIDAQIKAIRDAGKEVEKTLDIKKIKAYRHEVERRVKLMERQRKLLKKQKSPEEKRIEMIDKEMTLLRRMSKMRDTERQILVLRGKQADKTLATDREVLGAMAQMIPKITELTAAINAQADALWTRFVPALEDTADAGGGVGESSSALDDFLEATANMSDLGLDELLRKVEEDASEAMEELVASLMPDMEGYLKEHWGGMVGAGVGGGIGFAFGGPVGAIVGAAVGAMIGHLAQKFGPDIIEWFQEHWKEVLKTVTLFFFTGLPGAIIANKFGIRTKIKELLGTIKDAFTGWFTEMVGWFGDRISDFADWGKNLGKSFIDALIKAIKDMGGLFADALKGVVKGAVGKLPGPLKAGVEKVLDWGGFQQGLWEVPATMPAILHPGEMVVPARQAEMLRGETSGRGGGSVDISVNVSGFGDYETMKRKVLAEVETQLDSEAARTGVASPLTTQGVGVPRL